jgi:predicted HicB family RNase H-like nuclease
MAEVRFDGYAVNLYLDDDGDWLAHFLELPEVSAFADTPERALDELAVAWEGVKQTYREDGQPIPVAPLHRDYSGRFNVRVNRTLHRDLAVEAAREGVSLNALVTQKLSQSAWRQIRPSAPRARSSQQRTKTVAGSARTQASSGAKKKREGTRAFRPTASTSSKKKMA